MVGLKTQGSQGKKSPIDFKGLVFSSANVCFHATQAILQVSSLAKLPSMNYNGNWNVFKCYWLFRSGAKFTLKNTA